VLVSNHEPKIFFKKEVQQLLFVCLMPCVKKALAKANLQHPKGTSHFGRPVVQHETNSKGSEYSAEVKE